MNKISKSNQEFKPTTQDIYNFVSESNKIEGIVRDPTQLEINEFHRFINLTEITVQELINFVKVYQPNAVIRDRIGLDVRVGNYIAPRGGAYLLDSLNNLLEKDLDAYDLHCQYEQIHPFTDGNGRSGRALWAWKMQYFPLGFLHKFYYQSLDSYRK